MHPALRSRFPRHWLDFVVRALARTGVTPNAISWAGFLVAVASGALAGSGLLVWAGAISLFGGALDMLDGALARQTGRSTVFGALLDSSLDRYDEAVLLIGVCYWSAVNSDNTLVLLCVLALVGSLMVSYVKARAEGLGLTCDVGMFARPERVVVMGLGLMVGLHVVAVALVAVIANITAMQRLLHVYRQTGGA
ncbi:MAG: CDP-alcohol phosphatidyltransferase family protein [Dehalococcoidia bacterium]|nr:CDP-alcohol phosphatidyltransferase family protein [Dehalococcoidia bacterium]